MEGMRELLSLSIEEEDSLPPLEQQTIWYPEHVDKIESDKSIVQPDIHKVWIRTSDSKWHILF